MYYSDLVEGLIDLRRFSGFTDIRIRPSVSDQIDKLYNVDEGSAFYTLLGMLFIDGSANFGDCSVDEGLAQLHRIGKNKLDEVDIWAMGDTTMTKDVQLALGMVLAWQCDATYTTINGHRLFSTVNGSYASSGNNSWANYLVPGQVWCRQRDETIDYVLNYHPVMNNRQFRYVIRDIVKQVRLMYREKTYMEFITVLSKCRELIKRG